MPKLAAIDDISTYRKVADAAYRRGKFGLSVKDEQDAAKYGKTVRDTAIEVMGESGNAIRDMVDVENATVNAAPHYARNLTTEKGRAINKANVEFSEKELAAIHAARKARNRK